MRTILLSGERGKGKFALVDDSDFEFLSQWKWHLDYKGYVCRGAKKADNRDSTTIRMHREIMGTPKGMETDHKDNNKINNQRNNLRIATLHQNLMGKSVYKNSISRFKGVSRKKKLKIKPWEAYIRVDKKRIYLGIYETPQLAAIAYNSAAIKYFGEFARLNLA